MPQLVKKRRSGWAVLAMGALIASLLAVGPAPAGAAEIETGDDNKAEPSVEADFSACVGDALDDAGFTDLGSLEAAVDDINCLAYYNITTGRTADTFDPDSNVRRSNMALFLYRAANAAGDDLMGGDGDADFGDIAELGEDRQTAITALARNNILAGRSDMTFDPGSDITRAEMAVALVGLVRHTSPGLFNKNGTLKLDTTSDLDYFADSRAAVPVAVDSAISYLYELDITTGYDDATFRPNASVPRRNMASFIMRALDHTNTRPAGVTAQVTDGDSVTVSVRDADFEPVANASVDAFAVAANRADDAFDEDGTCTRLPKSVGGGDKCEIDDNDDVTDADGQVELLQVIGDVILGLPKTGAVVWVWTADEGDEVDDDTNLYELEIEATPPDVTATSANISSDLHKAARSASYGSTVIFTVQLKGMLAGETVDAPPDDDGTSYSLTVTYPNGRVTVEDVEIEAEGSATFGLSLPDPDSEKASPALSLDYVLSPKANSEGVWAPDCDGDVTVDGARAHCDEAEVSDKTGDDDDLNGDRRDVDDDDDAFVDPNPDSGDDDHDDITPEAGETDESRPGYPDSFMGSVRFDDDSGVATSVVVMADAYDFAPGTGSTRAYATVIVLDQYGSGVRNVSVYLTDHGDDELSDDDRLTAAEFIDRPRRTVSSGATRIPYDVRNLTSGSQTFNAFADIDDDGEYSLGDISSVVPHDGDTAGSIVPATTVYWVVEADDDGSGMVVQGDLETNEIVVGTTVGGVVEYSLLVFDDSDQFQVDDATEDADEESGFQCARTFGMVAFTAALASDGDLTDDAPGVHSLRWGNYNPDDSDDVTGWELTVGPPHADAPAVCP